MKTSLRLVWILVALFACLQTANAQQFAIPAGGINGPTYGAGVYEPGAFQATGGDLGFGFPGRVWFNSSFADRALGYEGSYLTLGAKTRLFNDFLDGRWLTEVRAHYSLENQRFFGNIGLERVFSIDRAGADVSISGWIDYDDDAQDDFGHTFTQVGLSSSIKTRGWDFVANGYFPFETQDFQQIGTVDEFFFGNNILLSPGSDSGLGGFDALLRFRPKSLGRVNGSVAIGGYGYGSELIDYVGGVRFQTGMQLMSNLIINAEVNHDDRFDTTGVISLGWTWGVNARGTEYSTIGRDLERTARNDHIVRFSESAVFAINPLTGLPYNVIHVENTASSAVEDGTKETPFNQLADAELASSPNDIIFVHTGNGNPTLLDSGIRLQDGQLLLGDGAEHILPIQDGLNFQFGVDNPALRPTIANFSGGNVVTLANNNLVRGFNIDGRGAANGISADGATLNSNVFNGTIEEVSIATTTGSGIRLNRIAGDWNISNVDSTGNGLDGLLVEGAAPGTTLSLTTTTFDNNQRHGVLINDFDAESVSINDITATGNDFDGIFFNSSNIGTTTILNSDSTGNGRHGLHFNDYDGESIAITNSRNIGNGADGLNITNGQNSSGIGTNISLINQIATGNDNFGVNIENGSGNLTIESINAVNNSGGIRLAEWTTNANQLASITRGNGIADFSNNGTGAGITVELSDGIQNLLISQVNSNESFAGLVVNTSGTDTVLNLDVIDNFSFSNNQEEGINVSATTGSTINLDISQSLGFAGGPLRVRGNNGERGLLLAAGGSTGDESLLDVSLNDIELSQTDNSGFGLQVFSTEDGLVLLEAEDLQVLDNTTGIAITASNNGNSSQPNRFEFDNILVDNNSGTGLGLTTADNTNAVLIVRNSVFDATNSTFGPAGPGFTEGVAVGSVGGIAVVSTGANNLTRVILEDNEINQFDQGGINLTSQDTSQLFADVLSNELNFNGFGGGSIGGGTGDAIQPFSDGIEILAQNNSQLTYRAENNIVRNSFEHGLNQVATDNASIVAILTGNDFRGNDIADDPNTPANDATGFDLDITNLLFANTVVSLSDNDFSLDRQVFSNIIVPGILIGPPGTPDVPGNPLDLEIALDGLTNGPGFGFADIGTPFVQGTFGTTGVAEFGNVESVFDAAGF